MSYTTVHSVMSGGKEFLPGQPINPKSEEEIAFLLEAGAIVPAEGDGVVKSKVKGKGKTKTATDENSQTEGDSSDENSQTEGDSSDENSQTEGDSSTSENGDEI